MKRGMLHWSGERREKFALLTLGAFYLCAVSGFKVVCAPKIFMQNHEQAVCTNTHAHRHAVIISHKVHWGNFIIIQLIKEK